MRNTTRPTNAGLTLALMAGAMAVGFAATALSGRTSTNVRQGLVGQRSTRTEAASPDLVPGGHATSPSQIPARGWKDILKRTYMQIGEDRVMALSAGVTYYMLLSMFPALVALVSVVGLFADPYTVSDNLASVSAILPQGTAEIIKDQVTRIAGRGDNALGITFLIGLGVALWSANAGVKALFDALNIVYEEDEKRGFFKLNAVSLGFTFSVIAFASAALFLIVALPSILERLWIGQWTEQLLKLLRWPILLGFVIFGLSLIYRFGPSRATAKWRWVSWGSAVAGLCWIAASALFSWYAASFGKFNETYGSLGAVIALMTWMWISFIVVLLGGELNSEIEHQTSVDSTTGPPLPMGMRGAAMADRLPPPSSG